MGLTDANASPGVFLFAVLPVGLLSWLPIGLASRLRPRGSPTRLQLTGQDVRVLSPTASRSANPSSVSYRVIFVCVRDYTLHSICRPVYPILQALHASERATALLYCECGRRKTLPLSFTRIRDTATDLLVLGTIILRSPLIGASGTLPRLTAIRVFPGAR